MEDLFKVMDEPYTCERSSNMIGFRTETPYFVKTIADALNDHASFSGGLLGSADTLQKSFNDSFRIESQLSQLVQAMAGYSGGSSGYELSGLDIHKVPNAALQNLIGAAHH